MKTILDRSWREKYAAVTRNKNSYFISAILKVSHTSGERERERESNWLFWPIVKFREAKRSQLTKLETKRDQVVF